MKLQSKDYVLGFLILVYVLCLFVALFDPYGLDDATIGDIIRAFK